MKGYMKKYNTELETKCSIAMRMILDIATFWDEH